MREMLRHWYRKRGVALLALLVLAALPSGCDNDGSGGPGGVGGDSDSDGDSDGDSDTDSATDSETSADTDSDTDTGTGSDSDTGTDTDTVTDTGTATESDTGTSTESDTGTATESDTGADAGIDAGIDASVDTDLDGGIDASVDTDTGTVVFVEEFDGSSSFTATPWPFGDPDVCTYTNSANSYNDGDEQVIALGCYDELILEADLALPAGEYTVTVEWRTGADAFEYYGPSNFWHYGAGGDVPKRLVVINGSTWANSAGQKTYYSETTVISYSGTIDTLILAFGSAGGGTTYRTYYDRVEIVEH